MCVKYDRERERERAGDYCIPVSLPFSYYPSDALQIGSQDNGKYRDDRLLMMKDGELYGGCKG